MTESRKDGAAATRTMRIRMIGERQIADSGMGCVSAEVVDQHQVGFESVRLLPGNPAAVVGDGKTDLGRQSDLFNRTCLGQLLFLKIEETHGDGCGRRNVGRIDKSHRHGFFGRNVGRIDKSHRHGFFGRNPGKIDEIDALIGNCPVARPD